MRSARIKNKQKTTPTQQSSGYTYHTYDIKIENEPNGDSALFIPEDYTPNGSFLKDIKNVPKIHGETRQIEQMTENSYSDFHSSYSDYKTKLIREMTNSVMNEASVLFGNQDNESRPYEEQREFQVSSVKNSRNKQMAKNITSRYAQNDI